MILIVIIFIVAPCLVSGFKNTNKTTNFASQVGHLINGITDLPQHLWNHLFHLEPEVFMNTVSLFITFMNYA